uniref:Alpha/beta hydrolase n=1 Tax=Oscillatoriales cyanobacterium SpSt-402 TaxID=2282168 RepID=A0A832H5L8_9CYAN
MSKIKNIVLVHGFWVDGSCYRKVIPPLLAEGYEVIAVQNPLTSLADDVAATKRVLARIEGNCILVGHSWGGFVITEVGNDEKVSGLVYIAAVAPDRGESMIDLFSQYQIPPALQYVQEQNGFIWLSKAGIQETFAGDLPAEESALLYATQTAPSALLSQTKATSPAAWKNKPSWYIVANNDQSVLPDYQRDASKRMQATTTVLESSHVPMLSHPKEVVEVIKDAAAKSD